MFRIFTRLRSASTLNSRSSSTASSSDSDEPASGVQQAITGRRFFIDDETISRVAKYLRTSDAA